MPSPAGLVHLPGTRHPHMGPNHQIGVGLDKYVFTDAADVNNRSPGQPGGIGPDGSGRSRNGGQGLAGKHGSDPFGRPVDRVALRHAGT